MAATSATSAAETRTPPGSAIGGLRQPSSDPGYCCVGAQNRMARPRSKVPSAIVISTAASTGCPVIQRSNAR